MSYLILMAGWFIYFSLHSILADLKVKRFFYIFSAKVKRWYRLAYTIIAVAGFFVLFYFSLQNNEMMWDFSDWHWIPVLFTGVPGILIMMLSGFTFDLPEFLGIKKSEDMDRGASVGGLIKTGLYARVRHPLYSGTILFAIALLLIFPLVSFGIFFLSMIIYLPFGMYFEEKKLVAEFGSEYLEYQKKVSRLIPGVY